MLLYGCGFIIKHYRWKHHLNSYSIVLVVLIIVICISLRTIKYTYKRNIVMWNCRVCCYSSLLFCRLYNHQLHTYTVRCTKCSGNNRFEIWSFCYPVLCTCDMFMGDCYPKTNVVGARWHAHARTPLMRQQQRATSCNAARCNYARRTISLRLFLDIHGTHWSRAIRDRECRLLIIINLWGRCAFHRWF